MFAAESYGGCWHLDQQDRLPAGTPLADRGQILGPVRRFGFINANGKQMPGRGKRCLTETMASLSR